MPSWKNWSGRHEAQPSKLLFPHSEDDIAALVADAARHGTTVRAAGSGHSHMPLIPNDQVIVDFSGLSGVVSADAANQSAWVWAGSPIYALGRPLHDAGLALHNQGDIDRQLLAGAVATGTHGTGRQLTNLSAAVIGARVALASGDVIECSAAHEPELFEATRLNLGAVGLVTQLNMKLEPAYRLRESSWDAPIDQLRPEIEQLADSHRHFEFFWYPSVDRAAAKTLDLTDDEPEYPLADEGARCGWNYEVLPNHRPHRHTEMEYSIPLADGPACLDAIVALMRTEFPEVIWPVEYRTLAGDDVWLSSAGSGPVATISVHQGIDHDDEPFFRACEAVFRSFAGRPHWGKVNWFEEADFASAYPRWSDWWRVRDTHDPQRIFLNDYLRSIAP